MIPDSTLDMHSLGKITPEQARFYLDQYLLEAYQNKQKQVIIITGKGQGVLRDIAARHLYKHKLVEVCKPAADYNGGSGAFEVYLKDC